MEEKVELRPLVEQTLPCASPSWRTARQEAHDFAAGSLAPSLVQAAVAPVFDARLRPLCFSGQRGASDAEDEDEHPERLSAQVRPTTLRLHSICSFFPFIK